MWEFCGLSYARQSQESTARSIPPTIEEVVVVGSLLPRGHIVHLDRRAGDAEAVRDPVHVHAASLELTRPRSVGVEQVGLWAVERLGLMELLSTLGINASLCTAAVASRKFRREPCQQQFADTQTGFFVHQRAR